MNHNQEKHPYNDKRKRLYCIAVGPINRNYYANLYETFTAGFKLSWNWSTFFLGPLWFFYRKITMFFISIHFILGAIAEYIEMFGKKSDLSVFAVSVIFLYFVVLPATANYVYFLYISSYIDRLKSKGLDEVEINKKLRHRFRTIHDKDEVDYCLFPDSKKDK